MTKIPLDDLRDTTELDRAHAVAAMMVKHGRGFTQSLGVRLSRMNLDGARKFKEEFPSYYRKHEKMLEDD